MPRLNSFTLSVEHHLALNVKHLNAMINIMKGRKDINSIDNEGNATLHLVIKLGYLDIVKLLIVSGADVNIKDQHNNTPLHIAALYGQLAIAEELLKCGAEIEAKNVLERTPLHSAVCYKPKESPPKHLHMAHLGVMPKLIRWGADKEATDVQGNTPYKLSVNVNNEEMAKGLLARGVVDPYPKPVTLAFRAVRASSSGSQSSFSLDRSSQRCVKDTFELRFR